MICETPGGVSLYTFVSELLKENGYLLARGTQCVLLDPGLGCEDSVEACILGHGYALWGIVLTHGHYDHAAGAGKISERFSVPVVLHPADRKVIAHAAMYARCFSDVAFRKPKDLRWLTGDALRELDERFGLQVLHVPGHTPGSIALFCRGIVFTGDTLLRQCLARTRLPEESREDLCASVDLLLREALRRKSDALFPGHGAAWDVGEAWAWWKEQKRRRGNGDDGDDRIDGLGNID